MRKLYSGWCTSPDGDYEEFDRAEIRSLTAMGAPGHSYYHFEYLDETGHWKEAESMECPELVEAMEHVASGEMVDKVRAEIDSLYEDGLPEIDIKMAIKKKYGDEIYDLTFGGE